MTRPSAVGPIDLVLFASRYAVQGVVVAYFFNFNKLYMEQAGVRVDTIRLVQTLALLPLVLKFLVGPLSDRVNFFGYGHRRRSLVLLAFGCLYGVAGMGVESNLSLYYKQLGLGSGADVGALGAWRNLGRAVGAVLLLIGVARLGRRAVLAGGIVGLAATIAGQLLVRSGSSGGLMGFLIGAANGRNDAAFAYLAMEAADPRMAASTFALFMAVTNLSVVGDALFARAETISGGYRVPLAGAALAALTALPLTRSLQRPATRSELDDVRVA